MIFEYAYISFFSFTWTMTLVVPLAAFTIWYGMIGLLSIGAA